MRPTALLVALYLALGWALVMVVPYWPEFSTAMGSVGLVLVAAGGVLHTIGAVIFACRRPNPVPHVFGYHEVFHALVIAAAICHYTVGVRVALPPA